MASNYPKLPLVDLVTIHDTKRKPITKSKRISGVYPYYGASGITDYVEGYVFDGLYVLLAEDGDNLRTRKTPISFIAKGKFWVNNHAHVLKGLDDLDTQYICYALQHAEIGSYISGSTRPKITQGDLKKIPITAPPLSIRHEIAKLINSFDQKIELNKQTSQTLEQMAQALFKSWFVDFDPVFDNLLAKVDFKLENLASDFPAELLKKAEIRLLALDDNAKKSLTLTLKQGENSADSQAPLPKRIAEQAQANIHKHFPSEFKYNENLGWIPKEWEDIAVNEMVKTVSETYPLKAVDKVVFLNTGDILNGKFLHQNYSETLGLPGQAKKAIKKGDILYSEIRPKNKRFALVNFDGAEHVVSTKLMVLRSNEGFEELFPYFVLTEDKNITLLQRAAESRSGTFPQITYTELAMIRVALPQDKKVMQLFIDTHLKNHFARKEQLDFQNETLAKLRDTLLPKLISGELQIPDVKIADVETA
jgi:type I restriction enzyme S subunit